MPSINPLHARRRTLVSLLAVCAMLPGLAWTAGTESPWDGAPYEGTVTLNIALPDGKVHKQHGEASVQWVRQSTNQVDMVLHTKSTEKGSMTKMEIEGNVVEGGWQSTPGMVRLSVAADGTILGRGVDGVGHRRYLFEGKATSTHLRLEHQLAVEEAQGGLPAGAVVTYDYDLQRPAGTAGGGK